jgi:hypothetical protein
MPQPHHFSAVCSSLDAHQLHAKAVLKNVAFRVHRMSCMVTHFPQFHVAMCSSW